MTKTKISLLKDGAEFYLSQRGKTLYRLDTFEKGTAVITSTNSERTFHVPKNRVCFVK